MVLLPSLSLPGVAAERRPSNPPLTLGRESCPLHLRLWSRWSLRSALRRVSPRQLSRPTHQVRRSSRVPGRRWPHQDEHRPQQHPIEQKGGSGGKNGGYDECDEVQYGDHRVPPLSCNVLQQREWQAEHQPKCVENAGLIFPIERGLCVAGNTPWSARRAPRASVWPSGQSELL